MSTTLAWLPVEYSTGCFIYMVTHLDINPVQQGLTSVIAVPHYQVGKIVFSKHLTPHAIHQTTFNVQRKRLSFFPKMMKFSGVQRLSFISLLTLFSVLKTLVNLISMMDCTCKILFLSLTIKL